MEKKYILADNVKLRSYLDHPRVLIKCGSLGLTALSREEFLFLLFADGTRLFEEGKLAKRMMTSGWVREWKEGDAPLKEWQKFKRCKNRFMPYITLEITERCNCNCLHCFNATGEAVPKKEMSYEQVLNILDQAADCGVHYVMITGGEPMLHPHFMDIMKAIHERGMFVHELNTNGTLLTEKILEEIRSFSPNTKIKISFDGAGFHDTMRGVKGCEQKTLQALSMSVAAGFTTRAQIQFNRLNADTLLPTLLMLDEMGVQESRVIRTTEAPRWAKTSPASSFSWTECFEKYTKITREYLTHSPSMMVEYWLFMTVYPKAGTLDCYSIRHTENHYKESRPICRGINNNMAVSAKGRVFPCLQMSGGFDAMGVVLGDLNTTPLSEIMSESPYKKLANATIGDRIKCNERCCSCPFLKYCGGGCAAMGLLFNKDFFGSDNTCCIFFRDHWYEKLKKELPMIRITDSFDSSIDTSYLESFDIPDTPVLDLGSVEASLNSYNTAQTGK